MKAQTRPSRVVADANRQLADPCKAAPNQPPVCPGEDDDLIAEDRFSLKLRRLRDEEEVADDLPPPLSQRASFPGTFGTTKSCVETFAYSSTGFRQSRSP